ncbi:hypothetical protein B0T14DRAFT_129331 [Immersiella caudata]|uniref:Uncharacterized protein n=1 Tax=Immersiella caudata TaxID=314043 RepID=A0AA39X4J5_9PEZI|nr:hypothetical protein B0T14DRAFT_129331 [Immersiella caudata]
MSRISHRTAMKIAIAALLAAVSAAFRDWPLVCMSSPPMQLIAGTTNVSAINENPYWKQCRAILHFADPEFVPITYSFTPTAPCSGTQVTSFVVPSGAPNGDARIIWQCKRSSACSFAVVSNGTGDRSLTPEQNAGTNAGQTVELTRINSATQVPPFPNTTATEVTQFLTRPVCSVGLDFA